MTDTIIPGFLLPHDTSPARLVDLLGGADRCCDDESARFSLSFYDSFDWRLYNAGLVLFVLHTPQGRVLRLKPVDGGEVLDAVSFDDAPGWPAALPESALKETVSGLLDMRVLLPLALVDGCATDMRIFNEDAKTVVRVQLLQMACTSEDVSEPRMLWPRVRVLPVKGYVKELKALLRTCADEHEWPQAPACLLEEVMAAVGREPGDYSSKFRVGLKSDEPAIDAMRRIWLSLLDTLERNIPGTREDLDSEFLHDLRVATRRTRSALTQVKRVLPDEVVVDFKQRFAWLGQITSPTRDLDVFLLQLPRYRESLPDDMRDHLDSLEAELREARKTERRKLVAALDSEQFKKLLADWRKLLEAKDVPVGESGEPGWFADLPIEQVASERIWKLYKRVTKAGRAAASNGESEAMHDLRKDCKKLRYLIEFFRSLYPAKETKRLIKPLKALLDNLGEFQDKEIQAGHLRAMAASVDSSEAGEVDSVLAIGALVADSLRAQEAAHATFTACFARFDTRANRSRYRALFK